MYSLKVNPKVKNLRCLMRDGLAVHCPFAHGDSLVPCGEWCALFYSEPDDRGAVILECADLCYNVVSPCPWTFC